MKIRKVTCILLSTIIMCSMIGCGKKGPTPVAETIIDPATGQEMHSYNIAVCLSDDNAISRYYEAGFKAALSDSYPSDTMLYDTFIVDNQELSARDIAIEVSSGYNIVFTCGEEMLAAAQKIIKIVPIVATDVYDFQGALGFDSSVDWKNITGRNVTGVSSMAPMPAQLSIMIEASSRIHSVALLQLENDHNAIYQNELLKQYLNQANIQYMEYVIPDNDIVVETDDPDNPIIKSRFELIDEACNQCNVLYIAGGSTIGQDIPLLEAIRNQSVATATPTFGGDPRIAQYTMVTLFNDPYQLGYSAGQKAAKIIDGTSAKSIDITYANESNCTKLYNEPIARTTFVEFPKSFKELDSYINDYELPKETINIEMELGD